MKFNPSQPSTRVENLAGGQAYKQSPELELVSILLTSFAADQFYRAEGDAFTRLAELIAKNDPEFVAKAAVYARTKFGMRSISHVCASELARHLSGKDWAKSFYASIVHRPDDMMEIIAYHKNKGGKVTNAMKKGFASAFDKFDKYQLAKYRGSDKAFKLVDVVNLVHPVPVESNAEAIAALIKGELKSFDTWESELTRAGQEAENDTDKEVKKKEAWERLINERKIGYFALLRNLRNIIETAPDSVPAAIKLLTDESLIRKSLVLPFRFATAYDQIKEVSGGHLVREVLMAINDAVDISLANVPAMEGSTLVVLDTSSSMTGSRGTNTSPAKIGSLFAAILVKANNADFMTFDHDARYVNLNPKDSTLTLAHSIECRGGSTNFHSIFQRANRAYDRVIILSDMQGWVVGDTPVAEFNAWKSNYGANPKLYSFDLQNYGSMQFPENNVYCLAGFSDKIFTIMGLLEQDKNAMLNEIRSIRL